MSLTYDEAFDLTNPDLNEDQRKSSALAIMAGTAANDIYWQHADDLTALRAKAEGHGAPPPAPDQHPAADAETTAIEEAPPENRPAPQPGQSAATGEPAPLGPGGPAASIATDPNVTIATLRKQLQDAGQTPEA